MIQNRYALPTNIFSAHEPFAGMSRQKFFMSDASNKSDGYS